MQDDEKNDLLICERYFKARGWELREFEKSNTWYAPFPSNASGFAPRGLKLPPILTDFPAFKEHVLEVMAEESCTHILGSNVWLWYRDEEPRIFIDAEIKYNNILHAAVQSATRYFEENK